jgi:hypothetical protein
MTYETSSRRDGAVTRRLSLLAVTLAGVILAACGGRELAPREGSVWTPADLSFEAEREHPWHEFPAKAVWTHQETGQRLELDAFWLRDNTWTFRFTPTRPGTWTFETSSDDPGLDGWTGVFNALAPSEADITANPNLRGQIRPSENGRYFEHADGTPFLLLADTLWAANTARAGLGENEDGPFFQYLNDRKDKGFTAVLMGVVHGFGDYPDDPTGHANEGGHMLLERDFGRLNPDFFEYADRRWRALHEAGFAVASPLMWWGKTRSCVFDAQQARKLTEYFSTRYGAFNVIWALSGEYQYAFRDCGWSEEDFNAIGEALQAHNPYGRPVSIHSSGQTRWQDLHASQSSRAFQKSSWLDHHWLQTGQSINRMFWIVERVEENRALEPVRPVFCSEAYYERTNDPERAYHSRWQAWTALLSGSAGYGHGAQGVWQFRDSTHAEPGKPVEPVTEWRVALELEGSRQAGLVAGVLKALPWERLQPAREALWVDGSPAGKPTAEDLTPPTHAAIPGELHLAYLPRGNARRRLEIEGDGAFALRWVDPRTGESVDAGALEVEGGRLRLPDRPAPDEDWVAILERR